MANPFAAPDMTVTEPAGSGAMSGGLPVAPALTINAKPQNSNPFAAPDMTAAPSAPNPFAAPGMAMDTNSPYMPTGQFAALMDKTFGAGNWTDTGDYRTKAREDQLRAQGAQTVAPGHTSPHSLGTPDAPGAHDIVVKGLTAQQAADKVERAFGHASPFAQVLAENTHGTQGAHLHLALHGGQLPPAPGLADPYNVGETPQQKAARQAVANTYWTQPTPGLLVDLLSGAPIGTTDTAAGAQLTHFGGQIGAGAAGLFNAVGDAANADNGALAYGMSGDFSTPLPPPGPGSAPMQTPQWAKRLTNTANEFMPAPSAATSVGQMVGGLAPIAATAAIPGVGPGMAAGLMGVQGAGDEQEKAEALGKANTPEASQAIMGNALLQGGLGMIPVSRVMESFVPELRQPLLNVLAKLGVETASGGAVGATMSAGQNAIEANTIDPNQKLGAGVGQSAAQMAALSFVMGLLHLPATIQARRIAELDQQLDAQAKNGGGPPPPPPPGAPPAPAPAAPPAAGPVMPKTDALQNYIDQSNLPPPEALGAPQTPEAAAPPQLPGLPPVAPVAPPEALGGAAVVPPAPKPPRQPSPAAAAEIAGYGHTPEEMAGARMDVSAYFPDQTPPNLFTQMRQNGGLKIRGEDGNALPGLDVEGALQDTKLQPGVINNKSGLAPDAMAQKLQEQGWLGNTDDPGAAFIDLLSRAGRDKNVLHPDEAIRQLHAEALEPEMAAIGAQKTQHPDLVAARLLNLRKTAEADRARLEDLRQQAQALGIPFTPDTTADELHGDVLERQAIQAENADLDQLDSEVHGQLLPEHQAEFGPEHDEAWAAGPEAQRAPAEGDRAGPEVGQAPPAPEDQVRAPGPGAEGGGEAPQGAAGPVTTEQVNLANGRAEQGVLPGAEQSAKQAAAARGNKGLTSSKAQLPAGGLFGPPETPEPDMFAPPAPPEPKGDKFEQSRAADLKPGETVHWTDSRGVQRQGEVQGPYEAGGAHHGWVVRQPSGFDSLVMGQDVAKGPAPDPSKVMVQQPPDVRSDSSGTTTRLPNDVPLQPPEAKPAGYGASNTVVKQDAYAAAKARLDAKSRGTQLNAGLDPQDVTDLVTMGTYHIEAGTRAFADFARAMLQDLGEWARPHLRMVYEMVRHRADMVHIAPELTPGEQITPDVIAKAGTDVSGSGPVLERDRGDAAAADGVRPEGVPAPAGEDARGAERAGSGDAQGGGPLGAGGGVHPGGAAAVGAPRDLGLGGRQSADDGRVPGSDQPSGSGERSDTGIQPDRLSRSDLEQDARDAAHVEPTTGAGVPGAMSIDAPPVSAELEEALPTLFPEQRGDVAFAEQRFAKPDGHGVMFTNGTGTGKTFTGLGVAKRAWDAGKRNILIVAPSQSILNHWMSDAKKVGLPLSLLEDTRSNGANVEGAVGTTYANLANNRTLADRLWDHVITDEAHTLLSSADGSETGVLQNLRAITNHPDRLREKARLQLRDLVDKVDDLKARLDAANKTYDPARVGLATRLQVAQNELEAAIASKLPGLREEPRAKVTFLSATPFAYDKTIDYAHGYLFDYGPEPKSRGYNVPSAKDAFFIQHFGYRMRYGKLTKPDSVVESDILERAFHEWMRKQGALSGRVLTVDKDYDRKFVLVDDGVGKKIDQALDFLRNADDGKFQPLAAIIEKRFDYLSRARLLEAIKAEHAVDIIQKHLDLGRKVVVFHNFNEGGGFSPFEYDPEFAMVAGMSEGPDLGALHREFVAQNPYVTEIDDKFHTLKSPIETITEAFPDAAVFNGQVSVKKRNQAIKDFNTDHGPVRVMVAQVDAAKQGVSLHDTTGAHQRVMINLGIPNKPTDAIQMEGRIYRLGQKSDAIFRYLNTGTNWERFAFASKIAQRAGTAENLGMGDRARTLRQSFIDAFLDSAKNPPAKGEGVGGKQADRELAEATSDFQKAKTYYYAQMKKLGGRANREGEDYYATPEPVGLKMTQWADIKPGEHVLEPSAGHGAIARSFPENSNRTLIEPSAELASKAAVNVPGADVRQDTFENLHAINKYDAIVMNPPFGTAGAKAIEHVAKAANHLRNGGRIVALIPEGSTNEKFEKFMASDAAKDLHQVGEVRLPESTFQRAGTKVRTRVVILEKQVDRDVAQRLQSVQRDFSGAGSVNELFDRIEHTEMPGRLEPRTKEAVVAAPDAAAKGASPIEARDFDQGGGRTSYIAHPTKGHGEDWERRRDLAGFHGGNYIGKTGLQAGQPHGWYFQTPEKRAAFMNDVASGATLADVAKRARDAGVQPAAAGRIDFNTAETKHGKTGEPVYVASATGRLSGEDYSKVSAAAKRLGGYYSSFRGKGAIPGFQFKTAEARDAFVAQHAGGEGVSEEGAPAPVQTPEDQRLAEAREIIRRTERGGQFNSGLDPAYLNAWRTVISSHISKWLGKGVDDIGAKLKDTASRFMSDEFADIVQSVRQGLNPLATGGVTARAMAKDFANAVRTVRDQWWHVDDYLVKNFSPEARERMWSAADEHGVLEQQGKTPGPNEGLNKLAPKERAAVEELQSRALKAFERAKALGMTNADALPSYVPRMVVFMTDAGPVKWNRGRATASKEATNLQTKTSNLLQRKHLTTAETEAAAQAHGDPSAIVVKDIRTLALATGKLEQAIAGRTLIENARKATLQAGRVAVQTGPGENPRQTFTIQHPSFRVSRMDMAVDPKTGKVGPRMDTNGKPVFKTEQLYLDKDFEGPMKAVFSTATPKWYDGLMALKSAVTQIVMYSPLMHNAVIWGKALAVAPHKVLIPYMPGGLYSNGFRAKNDLAIRSEGLKAGLSPIDRRGAQMDITGIAADPQIDPGHSWVSKVIGSVPGLYDRVTQGKGGPTPTADATMRAIDRLGDVWHNTFLWDRVADLQWGIYTHIRDAEIKKGTDEQTAQRIAAHFANRYAGSLPMEAMSKTARMMANLALFSRSFTLGNLGAFKDAVAGLPPDIQAQILRDKGAEALAKAQGSTRAKAMSMLIMDMALNKAGLLLAGAAAYWINQVTGHPIPWQYPWQNEPDKKDRFLIGYEPDGTAIYGRLPSGKVGEDFMNYLTHPVKTAWAKASPFGRMFQIIMNNDKGFGRKVWQPDGNVFHNAVRVGSAIAGAWLPEDLFTGVHDLVTGDTPRGTAAMKTLLPLAGITVGRGAPGGPAEGLIMKAEQNHQFDVDEQMHDIRLKIARGDTADAQKQMTDLGMSPYRQRQVIAHVKNPSAIKGSQLKAFERQATPDQKAQMQKYLQQRSSFAPPVTPAPTARNPSF